MVETHGAFLSDAFGVYCCNPLCTIRGLHQHSLWLHYKWRKDWESSAQPNRPVWTRKLSCRQETKRLNNCCGLQTSCSLILHVWCEALESDASADCENSIENIHSPPLKRAWTNKFQIQRNIINSISKWYQSTISIYIHPAPVGSPGEAADDQGGSRSRGESTRMCKSWKWEKGL